MEGGWGPEKWMTRRTFACPALMAPSSSCCGTSDLHRCRSCPGVKCKVAFWPGQVHQVVTLSTPNLCFSCRQTTLGIDLLSGLCASLWRSYKSYSSSQFTKRTRKAQKCLGQMRCFVGVKDGKVIRLNDLYIFYTGKI